MTPQLEFETAASDVGQRLDRVLARRMPERSRSRIQEWIRAGRVLVGGETARASRRLEAGDAISLDLPEPPPARLRAEPLALAVLHEDDDVAVIAKPAGLQVHPGAGRETRVTLAHALLARYPNWVAPGGSDRPGIVHRLDRGTSGLLVVARTERAHLALVRQLQARQVTRRYVALVWGRPPTREGRIDSPLGRDPRDRRKVAVRPDGRPAVTHWRVLRYFRDLTLLELGLETGRTHQIRVHAAALGHPLFGDPVYGRDREWIDRQEPARRARIGVWSRGLNHQALHAYHLAFWHPRDGSRSRFEAPVPTDLDRVLLGLCDEEASA